MTIKEKEKEKKSEKRFKLGYFLLSKNLINIQRFLSENYYSGHRGRDSSSRGKKRRGRFPRDVPHVQRTFSYLFFSSLFFIISMHYIISTSLCRTLLCAPAYISHTLCHVVIISFFFFSFLLYTNSHSGPGGRRRIFGIAKYHSGPLRFFSTTCAGEREFL